MDFAGEHYDIRGAQIIPDPVWPQIFPGGDHEIIIGRVLEAEVPGDGAPLVFWQGRYASLGTRNTAD